MFTFAPLPALAAMYALIAQVVRLLSKTTAPHGVPRRLMEHAGERAGLDSRHAQELRGAACAYLRVVR